MNNKIVKLQQGDYFKWKNLSREDKVKRNKQIAKQYLDKGPSIQNYYNALKAYFGGFNPKNPYLQTGEPIILPGTNPTKGMQAATKVARTLEDYLKTTKVTAQALEGSSAARSAYATDRYLGGVMFENNLPEAASQIQGHGMAKASTLQENLARLRYILDNGLEKGKTFFTAPLKVSDARIGSALGTGGGKPYFDGHFLITGRPGQMINSVDDIGTIYINDAYENEEALKAAQKMKEYLTKTYPNKVFKLYSEGFKKGGSIKFANARKWKHEDGGELIKKAQLGTQLPKAEDAAQRYKNGEFIKEFYDNNEGHAVIQGVRTNKPFHNQGSIVRKINYRMGIPVDTTYIETPPSLLPVKKVSRMATRYSNQKDNAYVGNLRQLYETLSNRFKTAMEVMRRKDGGILKAQYGAPLNLSSEDVQGGLKFLNNGLNKVLGVLNTPVAGSAPTIAYLPNGQQIEIPGTQGGAPDILPGKIGGAKKLQSVAKIKDKGLTVTKQLDSAVRHDMVNIDQDLRHYGFKTKRISPEELIDKMKKYREFREYSDHLTKRLNNLKRDNKQSMKDFKALKNKYEDMFNDFLHNGVKKHQEGAKLTFGQKLGNFAKSDLGKSVISNGLSFLSDKLFNKSASSNQEIAQAAQEKEQSTIDPMQVAQMIEIARNQYADSDNPNANGGDIFNSYIKNQITAPILARQQEEHKKRLAAIDQQKNQAKSSAVGTFFNTLAQGGIEYLQNKYGTTEKADS